MMDQHLVDSRKRWWHGILVLRRANFAVQSSANRALTVAASAVNVVDKCIGLTCEALDLAYLYIVDGDIQDRHVRQSHRLLSERVKDLQGDREAVERSLAVVRDYMWKRIAATERLTMAIEAMVTATYYAIEALRSANLMMYNDIVLTMLDLAVRDIEAISEKLIVAASFVASETCRVCWFGAELFAEVSSQYSYISLHQMRNINGALASASNSIRLSQGAKVVAADLFRIIMDAVILMKNIERYIVGVGKAAETFVRVAVIVAAAAAGGAANHAVEAADIAQQRVNELADLVAQILKAPVEATAEANEYDYQASLLADPPASIQRAINWLYTVAEFQGVHLHPNAYYYLAQSHLEDPRGLDCVLMKVEI